MSRSGSKRAAKTTTVSRITLVLWCLLETITVLGMPSEQAHQVTLQITPQSVLSGIIHARKIDPGTSQDSIKGHEKPQKMYPGLLRFFPAGVVYAAGNGVDNDSRSRHRQFDQDQMQRLSGRWAGDRLDSPQCEYISWEMDRRTDGTFELRFYHDPDRTRELSAVDGTWWVEDGVFYEIHGLGNERPARYAYQILTTDEVYFLMLDKGDIDCPGDYQFTDRRVK